MTNRHAHYRIVNHKRFIAFVVVCIVITVCIMNLILGLCSAQSMTETSYLDYEVCYGDTLWNIAETYMSDYSDIREAVFDLCRINNINAGDLKAGMIIEIPI